MEHYSMSAGSRFLHTTPVNPLHQKNHIRSFILHFNPSIRQIWSVFKNWFNKNVFSWPKKSKQVYKNPHYLELVFITNKPNYGLVYRTIDTDDKIIHFCTSWDLRLEKNVI